MPTTLSKPVGTDTMSDEDLEQEQSLESLDVVPESEEMNGEETQEVGGTEQYDTANDDAALRKPMPKPEDYDFFLNIRRRNQKDPIEGDKSSEH